MVKMNLIIAPQFGVFDDSILVVVKSYTFFPTKDNTSVKLPVRSITLFLCSLRNKCVILYDFGV